MSKRDEITKYSGENDYRKSPRLNYPIVQLDGDKGIFTKGYRENDEWKKMEVGQSIEVIILRVRRKLADWNTQMYSTEHNHPNNTIILYRDRQQIDKGVAKELRQKPEYKELKTQQILYSYLGDEMVKIQVKGSSLGSENKPKDSIPFYEYLSSFDKDEHIWEYYTRLVPKEEKKGNRRYFAISFERGEKIPEKQLDFVAEKMKVLFEAFESEDSYNLPEKKEFSKPLRDELPTVQVDEEEIKPEDLPF